MIAIATQTLEILDREFHLDPEAIRVLLLTDAYPESPHDHYIYAEAATPSWVNLQELLAGAGLTAQTYQALLDQGVLLDTCLTVPRPARVAPWHLRSGAVRIAQWIESLPALKAIGLMGDVPIRCFNEMARPRVATSRAGGAAYRMHGADFFYGDIQVFPTYLPAPPTYQLDRPRQHSLETDLARLVRFLAR